MGGHPPAVWLGFTALVAGLLVLDLAVVHRKSHAVGFREAVVWSAWLIALALLFGGWLWYQEGPRHALEYLTGYLIEKSLSVDNLFVFLLIFQYFAVPPALQSRVLKWGIIGALVMRAVMIAMGALLLERFTWIIYVFGGILLVTGVRMYRTQEQEVNLEERQVVKLARRLLPFSPAYDGQRFFTRTHRGLVATPLLLVLLVVEWSDLVFAIDSIPAIFAITRDPFLVYSSNVFAILGLRALFFVLAGMLDKFVYLKPAVATILVFVGAKMVLSKWFHPPIGVSLGVIVTILAVGVVASLRRGHGAEEVAGAA